MAHNNKSKPFVEDNADYLKAEIESSDQIAVKIAEKYEKKHSIRHLYNRQSEFIIHFLKALKVNKVIDLGCGIGNFMVKAQVEFPYIIGVDPGPESLEIAKKIIPSADFLIGKGEKLPLGDSKIDAVVMKGVVHHLKDPVKVFKEIYRCLKPGGILVIFEGNHSSLYRRTVLNFADLMKYKHETSLFEHRSPEVMKRMLSRSKLKLSHCLNVSGLFAPLALFGIGGILLWNFIDRIENLLQKYCPVIFNYYILLVAIKPEEI